MRYMIKLIVDKFEVPTTNGSNNLKQVKIQAAMLDKDCIVLDTYTDRRIKA